MAELFDIMLRRAVYVEGLKGGKNAAFHVVIGNLNREIRSELAHVDFADLSDLSRTAIRKLIASLKDAVRRIFDPWLKSLLAWLEEYVRADWDMLLGLSREAGFEPKARFADKEPSDLFAAFLKRPMAATGTLLLPFAAGFALGGAVRIERTVMTNVANRATKDDLLKALVGTPALLNKDGATDALERQARAVQNTIIQHLSAQLGETLADALTGWYDWISVLDGKTTRICIDRDGNRYQVGKGPIPPAHVNCRSTTVPVHKDAAPTSAINFGMWASNQPEEFVNDALDGRNGGSYEGTRPLSLADYIGKRSLIGA